MRKSFVTFLLLLSLLQTRIAFGQQAKLSGKDTICTPIADYSALVRNRDILAEQRNALVERVNKLQEDNFNFTKALEHAEKQIVLLGRIDTTKNQIVATYEADALVYRSQIVNNRKEINELKQLLKRQVRKTKFTAFLGVASSAVLGFLYFTK